MEHLGIVILAVFAIGIYSILKLVFVHARALFGKQQPGQQQKKKYIRIGHEEKLVCFDDLPEANKYKGRTWLRGLPVYADIVAPDKHDYSTIIYMDHWFKQYVHDVMLGIPVTKEHWKGFAYQLFFPVILILVGVNPIAVSVVATLFFAWEFLLLTPKACRATRRMGENAKDITPVGWAKIYDNVAKELAEEERLVSALRRSGMGGWHWW